MRTFLAVSPPREISRELFEARAVLRDAWKGVRWVKPEHFHITLVFLGDQDEKLIEKIHGRIPEALKGMRDFDISLEGAGCFGPVSRPQVFIEKVGPGRDNLGLLRDVLRPVLEPLTGWNRGAYRPHLTLGRSRRRGLQGPAGGGLLPLNVKRDNVKTFPAGEVNLYQSILHPEGAQYVRLESWPLKEDL